VETFSSTKIPNVPTMRIGASHEAFAIRNKLTDGKDVDHVMFMSEPSLRVEVAIPSCQSNCPSSDGMNGFGESAVRPGVSWLSTAVNRKLVNAQTKRTHLHRGISMATPDALKTGQRTERVRIGVVKNERRRPYLWTISRSG
jgi:hypothetical protein